MMGQQRCLVLGASGFLGKNLCRTLRRHGYEVLAYGRDAARMQELAALIPEVHVVTGDFVRTGVPTALLDAADIVFHLISTTKPANKDVKKEFVTNVVPTVNLLDACAARHLRLVYFSSGGTVYGLPRYVPIDEGHRTEPISAYGIHKLSVEKCIEFYGRTYGLDYEILRISNPYGRYQDPLAQQGVMAVFMARAILGQPIAIWGDGSVVRDYIDVDDVMAACLKLLAYRGVERIFNIGSGKGYSLQAILYRMERELGQRITVQYQPSRVQDVPANVLDNSLAEKELSWQPHIGIEEGIHKMHQLWHPEQHDFSYDNT